MVTRDATNKRAAFHPAGIRVWMKGVRSHDAHRRVHTFPTLSRYAFYSSSFSSLRGASISANMTERDPSNFSERAREIAESQSKESAPGISGIVYARAFFALSDAQNVRVAG